MAKRAKRAPVLALELMPCVEQPARKRDDWLDECADYWRRFAPEVRVPYAQLLRWRGQYGFDLPLDVLASIADSGRRPTNPTAYLAKVLILEHERRQTKMAAAVETQEEPDAFDRMLGYDEHHS